MPALDANAKLVKIHRTGALGAFQNAKNCNELVKSAKLDCFLLVISELHQVS